MPSPGDAGYFPEGTWHKSDTYKTWLLPAIIILRPKETCVKPLGDFCSQWPLECDQMGVMTTVRSPKLFCRLVTILEKTWMQLVSLMSRFICCYINVQDTAEIKQ